jgi:hypothetical protein
MTDAQVLECVVSGTTYCRNKQKPTILYNDGVRFMVKHPPYRDGSAPFERKWQSGWVTLHQGPNDPGKTIWDTDRTQPLTRKRLLHLCTQHGLNSEHLRK